MNRRRFLFSGVAGAAAYSILFEPEWLEFSTKHVTLPGFPRVPVRLMHIADLHASFCVPMSLLERAIGMCEVARPDLTCITGDFITFRGDFDRPRYVRALRRLASVAPTFAVLGNHDGGVWAEKHHGYPDTQEVRKMLNESGIRLLHNTNALIKVGGTEFRLAGVGDLWANEIAGAKAFEHNRECCATVLMSHNPDSKAALAQFPWDLMLSGHTHGGQVILPLWGPDSRPYRTRSIYPA